MIRLPEWPFLRSPDVSWSSAVRRAYGGDLEDAVRRGREPRVNGFDELFGEVRGARIRAYMEELWESPCPCRATGACPLLAPKAIDAAEAASA